MIYAKNKKANKIISKVISVCRKEILSSFISPESILLHGSFARGEGFVVVKNNKLCFVSDVDIAIITKVAHTPEVIQRIKRKAAEVCPDLEVHLKFINPAKLKSLHDDISSMDLKYQSKLLYGKSVSKQIKINEPRAIKTSIRYLMAKSRYLLMNDKKLSKLDTIIICARTYAEIATVLCTKSGAYIETHEKQCNVLKEMKYYVFDKDFVKRVIKFTRFKIGYDEKFRGTKEEIFKQTLDDLYCMWAFILSLSIPYVISAKRDFRNALKTAFFEPYLEEFFEREFGLDKIPFKSLCIHLIQIYDMMPFLVSLAKTRRIKNIYISALSPYIRIYSQILGSLPIQGIHHNEDLLQLWDLHAKRREHFL